MYKVLLLDWKGKKIREIPCSSPAEAKFLADLHFNRLMGIVDPDGNHVRLSDSCIDSEY